jgi:hypothetical protein
MKAQLSFMIAIALLSVAGLPFQGSGATSSFATDITAQTSSEPSTTDASDQEKVKKIVTARFTKPGSGVVTVNHIAIADEFAIANWKTAELEGEALLTKDGGLWQVITASGGSISGEGSKALEELGVPAGTAQKLLDLFLSTDLKAKSVRSQDQKLIAAAGKGDLKAVKAAIAKGANVNAGDRIAGYALNIAAGRGRLEVVSFLLSKGATVDMSADEGYTALNEAVINGHVQIAKILLDKGANPNNYAAGTTPLTDAITAGNVELVKLLLQKGADPNLPAQGRSPLVIAQEKGNQNIMTLLKQASAKWLCLKKSGCQSN